MNGPVIKPQPGPQTQFLSSKADVVLFGGQAFGGKSFALLLEPLRHIHVPGFSALFFRRTYTEILAPGGIWQEACNIYPMMGGKPVIGALEWRFPGNAVVKFSHLQLDTDVDRWNGAQVPLIIYDQLESFPRRSFLFMFKCLRSSCGVKPYMRASLNPDPNSFTREFLDWWIDGDTGQPILERSGVIRYFKVENDKFIWSEQPEPSFLSATFIPSSRYDNAIGMQNNPDYDARLNALPLVDRMRQRDGSWALPPASGSYFQRSWFEMIAAEPINLVQTIRYWDRAATEPSMDNPDPDYTVGCKLGWDARGFTYVLDLVRLRATPGKVVETIKHVASQDGTSTIIALEQEPGAAGKSEAQTLVRELAGYNVRAVPKTANKEVSAKPISAQAEAGNVKVVRAPWNDVFFNELEAFPNGNHDDQVDAFSGAYNMRVSPKVRWLPPRSGQQTAPEVEKAKSEGGVVPFWPVVEGRRRY